MKRLREERLTARARRARLAVAVACRAACRRGSRATGSSRPRPSRARAATRRSRTSSTRCCAREYFTPAFAAGRARAHRRSRRGVLRRVRFARRTSTTCSTSTRGCGCPTICSRRSTARRWRSRSKRACRISTTRSTAGARGFDPALKVRGDARKRLLKALAERYLPRDIVHREKQGFMMPLERWLAHELKPDIARALGPAGPRAARADPPRGDRAAAWPSTRRAARTTRCGCGCC